MTETQLLNQFVTTWARLEGFYDSKPIPAVSQRLCNPCNLSQWHDNNRQPYPVVCGVTEFPDDETGFEAARGQASINIFKRQLTFIEFFAGKLLTSVQWFTPAELKRFLSSRGRKAVLMSPHAPPRGDGRKRYSTEHLYRGVCPREFDAVDYAKKVAGVFGVRNINTPIASLVSAHG